MKVTFADIKEDRMAERLGMTPCDPDFLVYLNNAQRELLAAGRWWGTCQRIRICTSANCITWPREVRHPEAISACNEVIPVRNQWFEFQEFVRPPNTDCARSCNIPGLLDRGTSPLISDIVGTKKIRFFAESSTDYGKRILVDGIDQNGQRVRTFDSVSGNWVWGEYVTLADPFVTTTNQFQHPVYAITKPVTDASVRAYELDTGTEIERLIGYYSPSEKSPQYRRSYLTKELCQCHGIQLANEPDGCTTWPGCGRPLVNAIVRLEFIPVLVDSDFLMIGCTPAVELAIQAIIARKKENMALYGSLWRECIASMRQWHESYTGQRESTIVNSPPFGSAHLNFVTGGFI